MKYVSSLIALFIASYAFAASEVPQTFTLDGRLYSDTAGTTPLTDTDVDLVFQILNDSQTCILYEESRTSFNAGASNGFFAFQIGSATGDSKRTANDPGFTMKQVYSNVAQAGLNGNLLSNPATPCAHTPAAGDQRYLRVLVTPSDNTTRILSPTMAIDSVPNAIVAEHAESAAKVGTFGPTDLLRVNTAGAQVLSQANLENIFTSSNYSALTALLAGTSTLYNKPAANGTSVLPNLAAPAAPSAGQIWYNAGNVYYHDGSSVKTISTGSSTSVSASDGTAAAPSMSFASDPDTGWYLAAANNLAAATAGAERVRINENGNLGIGSSAPGARLTLGGDMSATAWQAGGIGMRQNSANYTDTSSSGTVGFNYVNAFGVPTLIASNATTYTNASTFSMYPPVPGSNVTLTNSTALTINATALTGGGGVTNGYGLQVNAPTGATNNYAATFMGGNVGVGTAAPSDLLHIESSGSATAKVKTTNIAEIARYQVNAPVGTTELGTHMVALGENNTTFGAGTGGNSVIYTSGIFAQMPAGKGNLLLHSRKPDAHIGFHTGASSLTGSEKMRIDSTGHVGVGTTAPTALMHIKAGTATAGTAPLKFTAGTNLTTPEDGAMEYSSGALYFTVGSTRYTIPLNGSTGTYTDVSNITNSAGNITLSPVATTGAVVIDSGATATSHLDGALRVSGGVGVTGDIYANGSLNTNSYLSVGTNAFIPQIYGSASSGGDIKIDGTSDATKGDVLLNSAGGNVGIGTTAPASVLNVTSDAASNAIFIDSYGNGTNPTAQFTGRSARGPRSNPTQILANDNLAFFGGRGYTNAPGWASSSSSGMFFKASQNYTSSAQGGYITLETTPDGSAATSRAERMRITQSGNVGIGTTAPLAKFQVSPAAAGLVAIFGYSGGANNPYININTDEANSLSTITGNATAATGALAFGTSTGEKVRITNAGNVGIGTTSPNTIGSNANSRVLTVSGDGTVVNGRGVLELSNPRAGGSIAAGDTAGSIYFSMPNNQVQGVASIQALTEGAGGANGFGGNISFYTKTDNVVGMGSAKMKLSNAGNLGVGTNTPTATVHIKAGTAAAGTAPLKLTAGTNLTAPEPGAIEYDGTSLFYTDGTSTRRTIATSGGSFSSVTSISNSGGNITMSPAATTGSVVIDSGTTSTSSTTGALLVQGGAGVTGDVYAGASINAGTTLTAGTNAFIPQIYGSASASGTLKLDGTSDVTKGHVLLNSAGGNVGIGTTDPKRLFHISGASAVTQILENTAAAADEKKKFIGNDGAGSLVFGKFLDDMSSSTYQMVIANTGNVGIGTTAPNVAGAAASSRVLSIQGDGSLLNSNGRLELSNPRANGSLAAGDSAGLITYVFSNNTGGGANMSVAHVQGLLDGSGGANGFGGRLQFHTKSDNASTNTARMTINSAGNVGIGTSVPVDRLTLAGGANGVDTALGLRTTTTGGTSTRSIFTQSADTGALSLSIDPGQNGSARAFALSVGAVSNAFYVHSNGRVGIGTTSPGSKLDVFESSDSTASFSLTSNRSASGGHAGRISMYAPSSPAPVNAKNFDIVNINNHITGVSNVLQFRQTQDDGVSSRGIMSISSGGTSASGGVLIGAYSHSPTAAPPENGLVVSGNVGIGTSAPTSALHLKAGAAAAGQAPLKLTAGTNLTTPEPGAIEYDGTNLYYTDGTSTRRTISTGGGGGVGGTGTTGKLAKFTAAGTIGDSVITESSGSIGIGTTAPGQALDVNGNVIATRFLIGSGTAGAPGLALSADTNTGFFRAANNTIGISTAGTEKLRIDGSGNIGIGTTAPGSMLDIQSTSQATLNLSRNTGSATAESSIAMSTNGAGSTQLRGIAGGGLRITDFASTTEWMRINSAGNIGIGTTAPNAKLEIQNANGATPTNSITAQLRLHSSATAAVGAGPSIIFTGATGNTTANYGFGAIQGAKESAVADDYRGYLSFHTQNSGGTTAIAERMRIDGSGNVGIGTTSPAGNLHIRTATTGGPTINLESVDTGGHHYGIQSSASANGPGAGYLRFYDYTAGGDRMVINPSGNVGIGTTAPAAKLNVDGGQTFLKYNTNTDYVLKVDNGGGSALGVEITGGANSATPLLYVHSNYGGGGGNKDGLTVLSNGAVGIGATAPAVKLDVVGTLRIGDGGELCPAAGAGALKWTGSAIHFCNGTTWAALGGGSGVGGSGTTGAIPKFTASGTIGDSIMTESSGRVGLGTTVPQSNIHIHSGAGSAIQFTDGTTGDATWADGVRVSLGNSKDLNLTASETGGNINFSANGYVLTTNNVGIGSTAPVVKLHTLVGSAAPASSGSTPSAGTAIRVENNVGNGVLDIGTNNSNQWIQSTNKGSLGSGLGLWLNPRGGNVGIGVTATPTEALQVNGNVLATAYLYSSDKRLKKDIEPLDDSLEKLLTLSPVKYRWIMPTNSSADREQIGLIAQEVREVYPQAVREDKEGWLRVDYPALVAPLVKAVQELYAQIFDVKGSVDTLQVQSSEHDRSIASLKEEGAAKDKEIEKLKQENEEMKARLDRIEKMMSEKMSQEKR